MKATLFAAGFALLLAGPAHASWAENANSPSAVYTGTDRSLARAEYGQYRHGWHHRHAWRGNYYYR